MTRTVTVALKATNTQFDAAYAKSGGLAKGLGAEVDKSGAKSKKAMTEVGRGGVLLGGALVAGFGLAVKAAADFNAQMSQVKTLSHATGSQLDQLRHAALTMGQAMGFSAGQTADAETELIKAGISVADIMGGALKGALALAAAGQIDVAKATEIAAIAMTQFKLAGKDVPHIADLLAAGADKALGGVSDLGEALKSGGLVAAQFDVSVETTIGVLAAFAQNGLMAESAGTDLRQMLLKLAAPSSEAADLMQKYGIEVYGVTGKFVGMVGLAGELHDKLGKLDEATRNSTMATIFGARAIVGANILYQNGAAGIQGWIDNVNASGFAMEQATGKMDNLKGDLSKLKAAFQTDLIDSGTTVNGVLRGMTKGATEVLKIFGELPKPIQAGATALTGIVGAAALVGGAALVATPKVQAFDVALLEMTGGAIGAKTALAGVGKGLGVIAALTGVYAAADAIGNHFGPQAPKVNALTSSLIDLARTGKPTGEFAKAFGDDLRGFNKELKTASDPSLLTRIEKLGVWLSPAGRAAGSGDAWKKAEKDIKAFDQSLAGLVTSGNGDVAAMALRVVGVSAKDAVKKFSAYAEALAGADVGAKLAGTSADLLSGNISASGAAAGLAVSSLSAYASALNLSKDEIKALSDEVEAWAKALAGFVQPLGAYTDLLKTKQDAEQKSAQATADATKSSKDSWKDYVRSVSVSVAEYEAALQKQVDDQQNWAKNMLTLSSRVSSDTLDQLARMGPEGAPLVAKLVKASGAELGKLDTLFAAATASATDKMATTLFLAQPVLTQIAAKLGQKTADKLAAALAAGTTTVALIAAKYGISIADGVKAGVDAAKASIHSLVLSLTAVGGVAIGVETPTVTAPGGALDPLGLTGKKHALGGLLDGPGSGTSDSMLIRASTGEFVVNAKATRHNLALLKAINDPTAYATGGLVGFAGGGQVGYNPRAGSLSSQANRIAHSGGGADQINALVAAYDAYLHALDQAAQREKLLATIHDNQVAKGKANAKGRAEAQQSLNDAVKALADFDSAAQIDREKAATDRLLVSMQKRQDALVHTRQLQDNMFEVGKISAAQEIGLLNQRMAGLEKYSDEWTALYKQQQQIIADQQTAAKDAADAQQAAADKAKQATADQLAALNKLLDEQQAAKDKLAAADKTYAGKQADLLKQQTKAETDFYAAMGKAASDYASTVDQLLATRQDSLAGWINAADKGTTAWGASVRWLTGNVNDQISAFADWMGALKAARGRGVSEAVISALGLDQGPQTLNQLRQFTSATQAEIDALNTAVASKTALAGQETHDEQVAGYGQLGQDLTAAQQSYAEATTSLQQQFQATQADLASQLEQAQADFRDAQTQYATDLAAIGQDQGRSYAAALADGLASGLPAVVAAAQALAAAASGGFTGSAGGGGGVPGVGGNPAIPTDPFSGRQDDGKGHNFNADTIRGLSNEGAVENYLYVAYDGFSNLTYHASGDGMRGPYYTFDTPAGANGLIPADIKQRQGYDSGGVLQPGLSLMWNGTGGPEQVYTPRQAADLAGSGGCGGGEVRVFIGDRELTDIVRVEREQGLGARKSSSAIAGKRP
jgi:TP901 family phage tail tape measure protein